MSALPLRVVLVLEEDFDSEQIEHALPAETRLAKASLSEGPALDTATARTAEADLVVVGCVRDLERALAWVAAARRERPDRSVVVVYAGSPNGFMQRAFEAGADDLITLSQPPEQLAFALEKALARRRGAQPTSSAGTVVSVLGPKGGTGKTLTSCNLAVALALERRSTVIVDLDLQFGDVGLALGLRPHRTIYDLAVSGSSLDSDKVDSFLAEHVTGARALLAPVRPDQAAAVGIPFLRAVVEILGSRFEFVIVDTPPAFTPEVIAAIDSSSAICMVGMLDALSLKDTKIGLETLRQMGYDPLETTLVLNRADTSVGITQADVEHILGRRPDVLVPSDRAIPRAVTEGRTIVVAEPRSGAARAFRSLAAGYIDERRGRDAGDRPVDPGRRRTLLRKGER